MHRIVQVVLVQFKASIHKERGRPRDWRLGPMKVQQQRRDASHDTHCLHPKSFAGRKRLQVLGSSSPGSPFGDLEIEAWPGPPWARRPPDGLFGAHERNGAVLLQNAASTPLGTHEHWRVHFLILRPGLPLLNGVGAEFIGVARKERRCFAAERGLDRLGHASLRMVYWGHTKGTALFCCRTRPQSLWAHTSTRGSIF